MGQFATVVRVLISTVRNRRHHLPLGGRIALEFIRHHAPWRCALAFEQLPEEAFGGALVAAFLDQNINRIAVLVNRPPQIVQLTANRDEHFIKKPGVAQVASPLLQLAGVVRAKSVTPLPNRFVGNLDSTLCQGILDIAQAEAKPMVQPNGVTDNRRRESMSVIQRLDVLHGLMLPDVGLS